MELPVQVIYVDQGSPGYHSVYYMARLAAELLNGELVILDSKPLTVVEKLSSLFRRKNRGLPCLLICPGPSSLAAIFQIGSWREKCGRLVAWVFDSFWTDTIPRVARLGGVFDHVFVTEREDIDTWSKMISAPVEWLPWGADVLRLGSANPARRFDLLRIGRQPPEWEDDASSAFACRSRNLSFHGRPPTLDDATDNQLLMMGFLRDARLTLAFSNLVAATNYTHPFRQYITGRWTDALAAGATVAGIPPRSESVQSMLWPEALLDLGTASRGEGLEVIARAVCEWSPGRARMNYLRSLERLDWRWRFKRIAAALDVHAQPLDLELAQVSRLISGEVPAMPVGWTL